MNYKFKINEKVYIKWIKDESIIIKYRRKDIFTWICNENIEHKIHDNLYSDNNAGWYSEISLIKR